MLIRERRRRAGDRERRATASLFFPEAGGGDGDVERKGTSPFTVFGMHVGLAGPPLGCGERDGVGWRKKRGRPG